MTKQIEKIREYLILGTIFLFPLIFADTFIDKTSLPKLILLVSMVSLTLLTFALEFYLTGKIKLARSKFDLPVFILMSAYLASSLFVTPNKAEAFFLPGPASLILCLGLLYFLINTVEDKNKIKLTLIATSVVLSLTTISSFLGIFDKISALPSFLKGQTFNLSGDNLTGAIFLVSTFPLAIFFLIKESDIIKKLIFALSMAVILIAAGISIFTLVSDKKNTPLLPSFPVSWTVATSTIGENPILGIGPGNYLTSFNRFRPATFNTTDLWQIRFATARNWYLTVITETGLLGIIGISFLVITMINTLNKYLSIYKESRSMMIDPLLFTTLTTLLIILAIFPGTAVTIFLLFILFALNSASKKFEVSLWPHNNTTRLIASLIIFALVALLALKARPVILAESKFKLANDALIKNDGKNTYDLLAQSINLNPYEDRYHASFAQVNLALARSIASSVKDTKDLTDTQKNTILQLIQQAIKEGQNTVALNPTRSANWQVLANIYQVVIPYAKQADEFAIQAYSQTINLDPIDPNLRIALGGLYYSLGKYDDAISSFQFAVYAKPDLANSYYNLSAAYAAKNDFDNAIAAMNKVLSIVPKDSNDYKMAQNNLESLQKKQKNLNETKGETSLTTPKKEIAPAINPQLTLPKEATPPAGPNIPSPSPVATPTP